MKNKNWDVRSKNEIFFLCNNGTNLLNNRTTKFLLMYFYKATDNTKSNKKKMTVENVFSYSESFKD